MRIGRVAATLTVLPALVLSPLTAQAILIHDHHGHETHAHAISVHELDEVDGNPEHRHEEHEHDGSAVDYSDSDEPPLVILLDLPEGLAGSRAASSGGTSIGSIPVARMASTNAVAIVAQQCERSYGARPSGTAPPLRARGSLEGILLTSHALLL